MQDVVRYGRMPVVWYVVVQCYHVVAASVMWNVMCTECHRQYQNVVSVGCGMLHVSGGAVYQMWWCQ